MDWRLAGSLRLGRRDERDGELLAEGKGIFHPAPVAGERLGPVAAVHGAAQVLVRLEPLQYCLAKELADDLPGRGDHWNRHVTGIEFPSQPGVIQSTQVRVTGQQNRAAE